MVHLISACLERKHHSAKLIHSLTATFQISQEFLENKGYCLEKIEREGVIWDNIINRHDIYTHRNKHQPGQQQTGVTVKWMKNTVSKVWHIFNKTPLA